METGFPTSLVDLFVKNRDRMRKSKNKKKKKSNRDVVNHVDDVHVAAADGIGSEMNNSCRIVRPSCGQIKNLSRVNEEEETSHGDVGVERSSGFGLMGKIENQNRGFVTVNDDDEDEECIGMNSSTVIVAALKVFVVVVLALSTKRLALGITLSAFVLLFLEFVSKRLVCFLKPCSKAKVMLNSMIQKNVPLEPNNFDKVESHNQLESFGVSESSVIDTIQSNSSIEEIHIADSKHGEFSSTRPQLEFLSRETKFGSLDMEEIKTKAVEDSEALVEKHKHNSKRGRIKAKFFKYFMPKRLVRGSNKGKKRKVYEKDSISEVSTSVEDDKSESHTEQEFKHHGKQPSQGSENRVLVLPSVEKVHEQKGVDSESSGFDGEKACKSRLDEPVADEKEGRGRKGILGYPILFLIGLAGLMGGRIVALLLTIAWCLMLKLIGTQALSINFPPLRSSVAISRKNFGGVFS